MTAACTCHRRGPTEQAALQLDLAAAESALREGDLGHARHHVAGVIGAAPTDARAQAVFERLAQRLDLTAPLEGEAWWGEAALQAFALQRSGRHDEAIAMLCEVTCVAPHLGYEHVLTEWVTALPKPLAPPVAQALTRLFSVICRGTIGLHHLYDGERALLGAYAGLAQLCVQLVEDDEGALMVASGLLRRAGRLREAVAIARRAARPDARVQEALALRAEGEGDAASALFQEAETKLGEPGAYRAERARCAFVAGHFAQALQLVPAEQQPGPELQGLRDACREPPPTPLERVHLLDRLCRATRLVTLDVSTGATANVLREPKLETGSRVENTAVAGWEPPSNRLALALLAGEQDLSRVSYSMDFRDFERPVLAQTRGKHGLWAVRGGVVVQAVAPPPAPVSEELAELAARFTGNTHQVRETLFHAARTVRIPADALEAALVHPPPSLDRRRLVDALARYQLTAAFALTTLPSHDGLASLESIIFGPVDWISGAAVIALGEWVRVDASVANRGRALLIAAVDDLLPHSCEPRFWPLASALQALPGAPDFLEQKLRRWYEAYLAAEA